MKKGLLTLLVFAVTLTLSFGFMADSADAKRGGGFKSNKQSFTQKNDANKTDNAASSSTQANKNNNATSNTAQTTKQGGLFGSGGGFMKGMLVGGLAGMLFGSMFGNMGAFGEILSVLMNLVIFGGIIMAVVALFKYLRGNKQRTANNGPNYNRYNDYKRDDEDKENNR